MARTLPPAKAGGGRLQHSSKTSIEPPTIRNATPAETAAAHLKVAEGMRMAGLGTPELQAAHHADIQQHVPRMAAWLSHAWTHADASGHSDVSSSVKPWSTPGDTGVYRRGTH